MWTGSNILGTDFEKIDDNAQFHLTACYSENVYSEVVKDFQPLKFESSDDEGLLSVWFATDQGESNRLGLLTLNKTKRVSFLALHSGSLTDEQEHIVAKKVIDALPKERACFELAKRIANTSRPESGFFDTLGSIVKANFSYLLSSPGGEVVEGTYNEAEGEMKDEIEAKLSTRFVIC